MSQVRLSQIFRSTLLGFLFLLGVQAAGADPLVVYDDQLQNGFANWGWADLNLAQNTVVRYGWRAISFEPDGYKALFFHRDAGIDSAQYAAVEFWIHGGSTGGQKIRVRAASGGSPIGVGSPLSRYIPGGSIPAGSWIKVQVPFYALDVLSGTFDGLWIQDDTGGDQAAVLIDDIELVNPSPRAVYDDQLRNGFADWSWAVHNLSQTSIIRTGRAAASFEPDGWAALYFHRDSGINIAEYTALQFYINGGSIGYQKLRVALFSGGTVIASAPLDPFLLGPYHTVPANRVWAQVRIPFSYLGVTSGSFDGFCIQDDTGSNQGAVYIDEIQLELAPVRVRISPEAGRTPISPLIYGVNFGSTSQAQRLHWPVRRWGGNATTRYSWVDDISNRGSDWFFQNIEEANANPGALPYGSAADRFIADTRAAGGQALITVPTIGWTPIDRNRRWGFSVAKYGAQQATECTATNGASWCQPDAGNGVRSDSSLVSGNDPHDTSREVGASFVTDWMDHLAAQFGTAAQGGVQFYALDNEPMLWNSTHRDVHPAPATYDEIWQKTVTYASAIKAKDPNAQIFGPVTWGWCDLFGSATDAPENCMTGDDRAAHGDVPFLEWYLQQVRSYQTAHGVRLVDWVDLHFYPQGPSISMSNDEGASASLRRLRSLRSLYDPAYVDESWIGQPVNLIPRVRQWIGNNLPGARLAITEYNWGADDGISSALAQAEALAIFGRQGVGFASRWEAPAEYSRVEDAFRLYLNYDGAGGKVSGSSVKTVSSKEDAVGAYTVFANNSSQDQLYILLFNKDTLQRQVNVSLTSGGTYGVSPTLFRFDEAQGLRQLNQTLYVDSSVFSIVLPARSATLAVLRLCNDGKICF